MFKVEDIKKSNELNRSKNIKKINNEENFTDYLINSKNIDEKSSIQSTSAIASADAIFATQLIDGEEEFEIRKKLVKKGKYLLDSLDDIRDALLKGEISSEKLIEISRMVKQDNIYSNDEKLKNIIQEIELRVEVELAKIMKNKS